MYSVYKLLDPGTDHVRYVGITKRVSQRKSEHCRGSYAKRTTNKHYKYWYANLTASPQFVIISTVLTKAEAESEESYWIKFYRDAGCKLVNIMDYGNTPYYRERHLQGIKEAWDKGKYNWMFEEQHKTHLQTIRQARTYLIECRELVSDQTFLVHSLTHASALTDVKKAHIHSIITKRYGYNTGKGWTFQKLTSPSCSRGTSF